MSSNSGFNSQYFTSFPRYQKLDFRLRTKKALRGMKLPPTVRSFQEFPLTTRFQKNLNNPVVPMGVSSNSSSENPGPSSEKPGPSSENPVAEGNMDMLVDTSGTPDILPYAFYPDRPPTTRQIIYQLCDIRCAEAQKLVSANDGRVRKTTVLLCTSNLQK